MDERQESGSDFDELPQAVIDAAIRRRRVSASIVGLGFLLLSVAPSPWNLYAPALFLIAIIYALWNRIRSASLGVNLRREAQAQMERSPAVEPYAVEPNDSKDPRHYKPID